MKHILLTGSSSGFGKLTAIALLEQAEHRVINVIRGGMPRAEGIFGAAAIARWGDRFQVLDLDLATHWDIPTTKIKLHTLCAGRLDAVINNAGYGQLGPISEQDLTKVREQFEVNFFSVVQLTQICVPLLRETRGRILNVSSICGLVAFPFYAAYGSSKFALEAYTESLQYELDAWGIQTCLIEPGSFKTGFSARSAHALEESAARPEGSFTEQERSLARFLEEKRGLAGSPDQVVRLILRLLQKTSLPQRVLIGFDARIFACLHWLLPHAIWRVIMRIAYRKMTGAR